MPEYLTPGLHVEEVEAGPRPIRGISTCTVGAVWCRTKDPVLVTSWPEFARGSGSEGDGRSVVEWAAEPQDPFALAVKSFFDNGGRRLWLAGAGSGRGDRKPRAGEVVEAIRVLGQIDDVRLLLAPGFSSRPVIDALLEQCDTRGDRFAIIDPPPGLGPSDVCAFAGELRSRSAALYYPWLRVGIDSGRVVEVPPSLAVAGAFARVDANRGVQKAPANVEILGVEGPVCRVSQSDQELLHPCGVNALRTFSGRGLRIWGARTLSPDPAWQHVSVRRTFIQLVASIERGTRWTVFEPNDEPLWREVRRTIDDFLTGAWRRGILVGDRPERAWVVRCDRATMTQEDLDNGRLVCEVGLALVRPGDFYTIRLSRPTADPT